MRAAILVIIFISSFAAQAKMWFDPGALQKILGEPQMRKDETFHSSSLKSGRWIYDVEGLGKVQYVFKDGRVNEIMIAPSRSISASEAQKIAGKFFGEGKMEKIAEAKTNAGKWLVEIVFRSNIYSYYDYKRIIRYDMFHDGKLIRIAPIGVIREAAQQREFELEDMSILGTNASNLTMDMGAPREKEKKEKGEEWQYKIKGLGPVVYRIYGAASIPFSTQIVITPDRIINATQCAKIAQSLVVPSTSDLQAGFKQKTFSGQSLGAVYMISTSLGKPVELYYDGSKLYIAYAGQCQEINKAQGKDGKSSSPAKPKKITLDNL